MPLPYLERPRKAESSQSSSSNNNEWTLLDVEGSCQVDNYQTWTIQKEEASAADRNKNHAANNANRTFLVHVPPSLCNDSSVDHHHHSSLILLSFHGYGASAETFVNLWKGTAEDRRWVVVAPVGTGRRIKGWNAIDCCGDPVVENVNDIEFVYGLVDVLAENLRLAAGNASTVVATGFSNGGFFSSLLGLQADRPSWLKAVIPAGGYQYDTALYDNNKDSNKVAPLPILSLHGGSDRTVRPDGCCLQNATGETNCPIQIGSLRDSCLSVQAAFTLWAANINRCDMDQVVNATTRGGTTCWEASKHCRAATKFCLWPKAGHSWNDMYGASNLITAFIDEVVPLMTTVATEKVTITSTEDLAATTSLGDVEHFLLTFGVFSAVFTIVFLVYKRVDFSWLQKPASITTSEEEVEEEEMVELVDARFSS